MAYFLKVDEIDCHGEVNKVFIDTYKIISLKEVSSDKGYKTIINLEKDTYYSKIVVEKLMKICNFNIVEE